MILDYLTVKEELIEPSVYRVSSIRDFNKCSYLYKLKYIDKIESVIFSEATITGNLCHDALEQYYINWKQTKKEGLVLHYLISHYKKTLINIGVIPKNADITRVEKLCSKLLDYGLEILSLYIRGSEYYKGTESIRTKQGKVASAIKSTSGWKEALEQLKLNKLSIEIDKEAEEINNKLKDISLSSSFAEAVYIIFKYKRPIEEVDVIGLEFPISHWDYKHNLIINPFKFPSEFNNGLDSNIYLKGSIDKISVLNHNGQNKIAILDYKSSKLDKEVMHVQHDVQLYSYAYCFEKLTGLKVDLIGIQNLRSTNLSLITEIDRDLMYDCLSNFFFKHVLIYNKYFHKEHTPDSTYSSCLNMFGNHCPYLQHCYPQAYNKLINSSENNLDYITNFAEFNKYFTN